MLYACGHTVDGDNGLTDGTLNYYAQHILAQKPPGVCKIYLDPHLIRNGLEGRREATATIEAKCATDGPAQIYCIFWARGHWALLVGDQDRQGIHWRYYDGLPGFVQSQACEITEFLTHVLKCRSLGFETHSCIPQLQANTCGTITVAHLCLAVGLHGHFDPHMIQGLHRWLLHHGLPGMFSGCGPEWMAQLSTLLVDKGVPANLAQERAQTVWDKLGAGAIISVMTSNNPWKQLKTLAGKSQPQLRLVKADELSEHIKHKVPHQPSGQNLQAKQKKKAGGRPLRTPLQVDTAQIEVYPGTFVDDKDVVLPNIGFDQVGADARGVALCTPTQALHFVKGATSISADALALALTDTPDPDIMVLPNIKPLTFPAKHQITEEPILFHGALLQLGDLEVSRAAKPMAKADIIDTTILKIQVYRDLLTQDWAQFSKAPVREIVGHLPVLRLCAGQSCGQGCPYSHSPVGQQLDGIIMELWGRNFTNLEGRRQPESEAQMFTVFLRIPTIFRKATLDTTAVGIFLEPRQADQRGPSDAFAIIWIPGADYEQVQHLAKTFGRTSGLARMKHR